MTLVPTISITTPDLESKDFIMNSPLTPTEPASPTIFDVVKNMGDIPELGSDDDEFELDQAVVITDEPEELEEYLQQQQDNDSSQSTTTGTQDDSQPLQRDQQSIITTEDSRLSQDIRQFYRNKSILITGATGFIGKALFWKVLHSLGQEIDHIYLLIRLGPSHRRLFNPTTRLQEEILSNKAFISLRRQMGPNVFDQLVKDKVVAINGDLLDDNLGLTVQDHKTLVKHVNVILHCGGNTDGNERLDISVKINAAGTNALINLANECDSLSSFVHLSPLKTYGSSSIPFDRVGILPEESSVEDIIDHILGSNLEDLPSILTRARPYYQNAYTFSKALAEQVLVSDARKKKIRNSRQLPVGILRLGHIGPSVSEPLKGWADDVNGVNGVILLTGRGTRIIDNGHGEMAADVIPVDFAVRTILSCAVSMKTPPSTFTLPMTDDTIPDSIPEKTSSTPALSANRDSSSSYSSNGTASNATTGATTIPATTDKESASELASLTVDCFPYIYHVSALDMRAINWRLAYEAIRRYWTRATGVNLSPSNTYFTASAQGLSRAWTVMNSLRSAASSVYMTNTNTSSASGDAMARPSNKRSSHRMSRYVAKAARLSPNVMRTYTTLSDTNHNNSNNNKKSPLVISPSSTFTGGPWMRKLKEYMQEHLSSSDGDAFDPYSLVPEDADTVFWMDYFSNASYGMHYFVGGETNVRIQTPADGWNCALQFIGAYGSSTHDVIDYQVGSELHSPDQVTKRMYRMIDHLKHLLVQDDIPPSPQQRQQNQQQHDQGWNMDMDDSLEDWCQDQMVINAEQHDKRSVLGKWRKKVGSNDDAVKVVVLNDKRVNQAIHQITQNAGVSKQTAVNEAMKILVQMSERTQLTFVWFTGSFLKSFFDHMFESIRISEDSIRYIRDSTLGKRVVYVPVSKSILDPLLVWYITIRYHLPVPALVCDEVMAQLGPMSDIYRLAGAYYVKRDKAQRSPLNSAVTAAYTQVLLREHGALSMCLEKSRSRTGKYQEAFDDEVIDMVMESTLQSNQSRSSSVTKVAAYDSISPPNSPDSPATPASATMNMDSTPGIPRKAHRDVMIVPINISYEIVPELGFLIDQVLDQQPRSVYMGSDNGGKTMNGGNNFNNGYINTGGRSSPLLASSQSPSSPLPSVVRPSQTMDKRNRLLDGIEAPKKCGRVHVGIGRLVSVQGVAAEYMKLSSSSQSGGANETSSGLAGEIVKRIQSNQMDALVVTPLTLVCATILYGRATGGVCLGKIKELLEWLRLEILDRKYRLDWQVGEDLESVIFSVFRLINEPKNLIIEGKELTDDTNIRVNDHADNIMALSYYSNQVVNIFLLDSFFCVVYLSFSEDTISEDEFMDRFRFLVQLLEKEFVLGWDIDKQFKAIVASYEKSGVIRRKNKVQFSLLVTMETNHLRYEQLIFLASLIYPTIDTYWITSCSLSALECVPTLPRSIVPLLSQWIATHLITGRRTIYREVLSTESSRMAVDVFMSMGFLTEFQAKEKLSPDAQILLHELKIPTTETLIELTGQNSDGGMTPVSPIDPEGMMKALMAQIQMNRANSNMADLCQQIDSYRLGAASQRESFQNAQVFQKCLKQIKGILQAGASFAKKRKVELDDTEDGMVQLVYVLRANSMASSNDRSTHGRALRRISEAYNLR